MITNNSLTKKFLNNGKSVDFSKTINSDDVLVVEDRLRGLSVILEGLSLMDSYYNNYALHTSMCICDLLGSIIKDVEDIREGADYMFHFIHENIKKDVKADDLSSLSKEELLKRIEKKQNENEKTEKANRRELMTLYEALDRL